MIELGRLHDYYDLHAWDSIPAPLVGTHCSANAHSLRGRPANYSCSMAPRQRGVIWSIQSVAVFSTSQATIQAKARAGLKQPGLAPAEEEWSRAAPRLCRPA